MGKGTAVEATMTNATVGVLVKYAVDHDWLLIKKVDATPLVNRYIWLTPSGQTVIASVNKDTGEVTSTFLVRR